MNTMKGPPSRARAVPLPPPRPPPEPRLFTVQKRRSQHKRRKSAGNQRAVQGSGSPGQLNLPFCFTVEQRFLLPEGGGSDADENHQPANAIPLGPLDRDFCGRNPTQVELLIRLNMPMDANVFQQSLRSTLSRFPAACGRRKNTIIEPGRGVQFSAIHVSDPRLVESQPPSPILFDNLVESEPGCMVTVRMIEAGDTDEGETKAEGAVSKSVHAIAICFDHALCDVSGIALMMAHALSNYSSRTKKSKDNFTNEVESVVHKTPLNVPMPPPVSDREEQQLRIMKHDSKPFGHSEPMTGVESQNSGAAGTGDHSDPALGSAKSTKRGPLKGGCGCVQWFYSSEELEDMKKVLSAHSRHDAAFTDVVLMLRHAYKQQAETFSGYTLRSATLSRDDRVRAGVSHEMFGNGAVLIRADLPGEPISHTSGATIEEGPAVAASIRAAVNTSNRQTQDEAWTDVHLNTWWHPLKYLKCLPMVRGFAIGPGALAAAAQICVSRGGQPNVTVLPSGSDDTPFAGGKGLFLSLLAPLKIAHEVLKILKQRHKEVKLNWKKSCRNRSKKDIAEEQTDGMKVGLPDAKSETIKAAIIWFHGLGDTRNQYWRRRFKHTTLIQHLEGGIDQFHEPRAPLGHAPLRNGKESCDSEGKGKQTIPSWFTVPVLPIGSRNDDSSGGAGSESEALQVPDGLTTSVQMAHDIALTLEREHGIPSSKIMFGGFSQGGALAIEAGITFEMQCAGIVCISGWWPRRRGSMSLTNAAEGEVKDMSSQSARRVPVLFCAGTSDPEVIYAEGKASAEALSRAVPGSKRFPFLRHRCSVSFEKVQRGKHMPTGSEISLAADWMVEQLS